MTTYQVGDVAETNDGRLAFVADKRGGELPLDVYFAGGGTGHMTETGLWREMAEDKPGHPNSFARLVWRDTQRPLRQAQAKRELAAKLLAEAEALEQSV